MEMYATLCAEIRMIDWFTDMTKEIAVGAEEEDE
jgi:hypothetical protein